MAHTQRSHSGTRGPWSRTSSCGEGSPPLKAPIVRCRIRIVEYANGYGQCFAYSWETEAQRGTETWRRSHSTSISMETITQVSGSRSSALWPCPWAGADALRWGCPMPGQAPALPVRAALRVLSPALCQAAGKAEPGPGEAKGGHSSLGRAPRKPLKANRGPHRPGRDLSPRDTGKGVGKPGLGQLGTHLAARCPCQDRRARGQALDP